MKIKYGFEQELILKEYFPGIHDSISTNKFIYELIMNIDLESKAELERIVEETSLSIDMNLVFIVRNFLRHLASMDENANENKELHNFSKFIKEFKEFENYISESKKPYENIVFKRDSKKFIIKNKDLLRYFSAYIIENHTINKFRIQTNKLIEERLEKNRFDELIIKRGGKPISHKNIIAGTIAIRFINYLESNFISKKASDWQKKIFVGKIFVSAGIIDSTGYSASNSATDFGKLVPVISV
ncbi:MAG: hypothetical protein CL663_01225 [Bacteroidetes bacterium]|nr:hypothetical protein [Bacteroidota bacterium]